MHCLLKPSLVMQAEPVAIMEAAQRLPDYTRVVCAGEMQHGRSILVGPRPRSIMGTTQLGCVHLAAAVPAWPSMHVN